MHEQVTESKLKFWASSLREMHSENKVSSWRRKKWKTWEDRTWSLTWSCSQTHPTCSQDAQKPPSLLHFSPDSHFCCSHIHARKGYLHRYLALRPRIRDKQKWATLVGILLWCAPYQVSLFAELSNDHLLLWVREELVYPPHFPQLPQPAIWNSPGQITEGSECWLSKLGQR